MSNFPPSGTSSEDFPGIQMMNKEYLEKLGIVAENLGEVGKKMSTRKFAKNTKSMKGMFDSMGKANIKVMVIQQLLKLLESVSIILEPFLPLMELLGAIIETFLAPSVVKLTKAMIPAYQTMLTWRLMVEGFVKASDEATTAGQRMNIVLKWFGTSLEDIGASIEDTTKTIVDFWSAVSTLNVGLDNTIGLLYGRSPGLIPALKSVNDAVSRVIKPLTDFKNLINNFRFPSIGGGGGGGGDGDGGNIIDDIIDYLIPGGAMGGLVKARPGGTIIRAGEGGEDELITPVSKLGGGFDPEALGYLRWGSESSQETVLLLRKMSRRR